VTLDGRQTGSGGVVPAGTFLEPSTLPAGRGDSGSGGSDRCRGTEDGEVACGQAPCNHAPQREWTDAALSLESQAAHVCTMHVQHQVRGAVL
jgi:hypothetical protein